MGLFAKDKKKSAIVAIILVILFTAIFSVIIVLPTITLHSEFPDDVIDVKKSGNVVCVYMLGFGTVNPNDPEWKEKEVETWFGAVSGFYASETGHIFVPAHGLAYDEKEDEEGIKAALLTEYIMEVKWFGEGKYNEYSWNEYPDSDEFEEYFFDTLCNASWIKGEGDLKEIRDHGYKVEGNTTITDIRPSYKLFSPDIDQIEKFGLNKIKYIEDRNLITNKNNMTEDIAVIQNPRESGSFITFDRDFDKYEEGTKFYIIRYGEVTIDDYMDEVDPSICRDYTEFVDKAYNKMMEDIKDKGADIESGYLGSSTSHWPKKKKGKGSPETPEVYRFTGYSPGGCSGSPVLDERGHCVGMVVCGADVSSVYFYPFKYLEKVSEKVSGFELTIYKPFWVKHRDIIIAVVIAIVIGVAIGFTFEIRKRKRQE